MSVENCPTLSVGDAQAVYSKAIESESFDLWNDRRLFLSESSHLDDYKISSHDLTALKAKILSFDEKHREQLEEGVDDFVFDFSTITNDDYTKQKVFVLKVLQQQSITQTDVIKAGRRLSWLLFMDPVKVMCDVFLLMMRNAPLVHNFVAVFNQCRSCFELKLTSGESKEMLCSIFVLRKLFHQALEAGDGAMLGLKTFNTLLRQLSRSVFKVVDGNRVCEQHPIIPATVVITDIFFNTSMTDVSADFILTCLNYMFGTGKENHVFVIQWMPKDDEPYILPRELYCYLLVVWRFLRRVDPTRTSIPMALRTLSSKLQQEKMCIGQDRLISSLLDECLWSEKFVLLKWIGTSWTGSVNRIPEVLHRMLQFKFKKQYCPIRCASRDEAPLSAFLDSVFELAVASMDLTRELLHEMMSPWFFDCTNEELRAAVLSSLVRQTQRRLEVENYRSITQILEICVRQFDWPLDLLQEVNTKPTTLLYEVALNNELITLLGVASLIDIAFLVTQETFDGSFNTSSVALATCFATESNRLISDLVTRFVSDQTVVRTQKFPVPAMILEALLVLCANVQSLSKKLSETPLDLALLNSLSNRLNEFEKQIRAV